MSTESGVVSGNPARFTVGDLLELAVMEGREVVAGESGLDRTVTGVNIIEVPDVGRWLRGGEFLFTAGYAWHHDLDGLAKLIVQLHQIGASGMGVKLGSYLPALRDKDLEIADALGFPIVRLPSNTAYMDVIEPLYQRLAAPRLWLLERTEQAQRALVPLGLDDQSVGEVVAVLAAQLQNPVYVVDLINERLVSAAPGEAARRQDLSVLGPGEAQLVAETDRFRAGRALARVMVGGHGVLTVPLVLARRTHGRVLVVEEHQPLDDLAEVTLAHAAETLSFLLMKRLARLEGRREAAALFLASLLSDQLSVEDAAERALTLGLSLTQPCQALVARVRADDLGIAGRAAERALSRWPHVVAEDHGNVLAIVQIDQGPSDPVWGEPARAVCDAVKRAGVADVVVAAGSSLTGASGVRRSRSEALIALNAARRGGDDQVIDFSALGVERLLSQIPATETTRDYLAITLGPILSQSELRRTLEVYLECGCKKVVAAAAIPLHRSSLEYRLEKIEAILGVDLDDPERVLELRLAMRLHRMLDLL